MKNMEKINDLVNQVNQMVEYDKGLLKDEKGIITDKHILLQIRMIIEYMNRMNHIIDNPGLIMNLSYNILEFLKITRAKMTAYPSKTGDYCVLSAGAKKGYFCLSMNQDDSSLELLKLIDNKYVIARAQLSRIVGESNVDGTKYKFVACFNSDSTINCTKYSHTINSPKGFGIGKKDWTLYAYSYHAENEYITEYSMDDKQFDEDCHEYRNLGDKYILSIPGLIEDDIEIKDEVLKHAFSDIIDEKQRMNILN